MGLDKQADANRNFDYLRNHTNSKKNPQDVILKEPILIVIEKHATRLENTFSR